MREVPNCTPGTIFDLKKLGGIFRYYYIKDVNYLISISQEEAKYLREHGRSHDIHLSSATHKGHAKRNWLTTSYKSMMLLEEYRNKKHVTTFGGE